MEARAAQKAEEMARDEMWKLRLKLGAALVELVEHPNSRLSLAGWTQKVTSYEAPGGKRARGFLDFRDPRLSPERVEKSIEDSRWWLSELEKGRVVGA